MSATPCISRHAVERFIERVRPGIDPDRALAEMRALLAAATPTPTAPEWVAGQNESCLLLGDICFPVNGDTVTTVLTRDKGAHAHRAQQSRQSQRKRRRRVRTCQRNPTLAY